MEKVGFSPSLWPACGAPSDADAHILHIQKSRKTPEEAGSPESASCYGNASLFCFPSQTEDQNAVKACQGELLMRRQAAPWPAPRPSASGTASFRRRSYRRRHTRIPAERPPGAALIERPCFHLRIPQSSVPVGRRPDGAPPNWAHLLGRERAFLLP